VLPPLLANVATRLRTRHARFSAEVTRVLAVACDCAESRVTGEYTRERDIRWGPTAALRVSLPTSVPSRSLWVVNRPRFWPTLEGNCNSVVAISGPMPFRDIHVGSDG
jgi:hypothetical protein